MPPPQPVQDQLQRAHLPISPLLSRKDYVQDSVCVCRMGITGGEVSIGHLCTPKQAWKTGRVGCEHQSRTRLLGAQEMEMHRAAIVQVQPPASQIQDEEPDTRVDDGHSSGQLNLDSNLSSAAPKLPGQVPGASLRLFLPLYTEKDLANI